MTTDASEVSASTVLIQAKIRAMELDIARHYPWGGQCRCAKALPCPVVAKLDKHRAYLASLLAACSVPTDVLPLLASRHLPMEVVRHRQPCSLALAVAKLRFPAGGTRPVAQMAVTVA